jgi:hypothetical protein
VGEAASGNPVLDAQAVATGPAGPTSASTRQLASPWRQSPPVSRSVGN